MWFLFVLNSLLWSSHAEWHVQYQFLTKPDSNMAGGVFNNSIFILGGNAHRFHFLQYDITKSKFIQDNNMNDINGPIYPYGIFGNSQYYSQFGNKLYILYSGASILIFDLQSQLFQKYNDVIPKTAIDGCLASTANYLFIIGGYPNAIEFLDILQIFDLSQYKFISNTIHMNEKRRSSSCAYHESTQKLYVIGGKRSTDWLYSVEVISTINITKQSWTYIDDNLGIIQNLGGAVSSAVWGDFIFIIGSKAATINVLSDSIRPMSDHLKEPQPSALVVINNNIIYALGGYISGNTDIDYLQYYELLSVSSAPIADHTLNPTTDPTVNPSDKSNIIINNDTSPSPSHNNIISISSTEYHKQTNNGEHTNSLFVALIVVAIVCVVIFLIVILYVIFKSKFRKINYVKMQNSNHPIQLMAMVKKEPQVKMLLDDNIKDRLLKELSKYRETMAGAGNMNVADINIVQVLDDYHSLLQTKTVINSSESCDVQSCDIFRRNYRNKSDFKNKHDIERLYMSNDNKVNDNDRVVTCQILDKIHSFCYHANDVFDNDNKETDLIKTVQNKMNKKYNQLYRNSIVRQESQDMFIFGWSFFYKDNDHDVNENKENDIIIVKPKYSTLRQELTCNDINKISMEQFINEYLKSEIHFSCAFKKQKYSAMSIEHIVSLMIYCNFDELQYEFSKTYRETNNKHENYYHLGKLLKQSVLYFGTRIKDGICKEFYHGITRKLIPSEIVGHLGKGVSIYCPLSTSTSMEVAMNFTSNNAGLIMTFGGEASKAKYFPVSWLSDFGNENEHLFLQNKEELQIENILDCSSLNAYEYSNILNALKTMDAIMWESHYFKHQKSVKTMAPMIKLIVTILHHQLSIALNELEWEKFDNLQEYGQQLLDVYFRNKTRLTINYLVLEQKYPDLFCLFCVNEFDWINIKILNALFSNIKEIEITNINLCDKIMEDISTNRSIFCHEKGSWNLDKMTIKSNKSSALRVSDAVAKYKQILKENVTKITIRSVDWENNDYDTLVLE